MSNPKLLVPESESSADSHGLSARFEELRQLRTGWFNGKGVPPSPAGLGWLANAFARNYLADLPVPYIYPTLEGAVRAEWASASLDCSLEIDLQRHSGNWHSLNLDDDSEESKDLNLDRPADWQWLAEQVRPLMEAVQ